MPSVLVITPDEAAFGPAKGVPLDQIPWHELPSKVLKDVPASFSEQDWVQYSVMMEFNWKVELFRPHPNNATDFSDIIVVSENCACTIS
ncbi:hypothetical protein RA27_13830 [Ruegeria sp. ANG-R]|nr:hypothetical protein RA27_13830 [Ruegeria sp. ANG-R]